MSQSAYCTYFDIRYLSRGLCLIESLRQNGDSSDVWVLCLDEATEHALASLALDQVRVLSTAVLEERFPDLLAVKSGRSRAEYYFTLTPWLCLYVREASPATVWVTYLDADLFFFSSPQAIFAEMAGNDVAIVPHRYPDDQKWRLRFGTYNVGWVSFRNSQAGGRCLSWWADRCAEWCFDVAEDGRFADQGYLDGFVEATGDGKVAVIGNPGVNLAPWNLRRHTVALADDDSVIVDGEPLVFFHFHGLSRSGNRYFFKHAPYRVKTTAVIKNRIYRPYLSRLEVHEATAGMAPARKLQRSTNKLALLRFGRQQVMRVWAYLRGDTLRTGLHEG